MAHPLFFPGAMAISSSIVTQELRLKGELAETYEVVGTPVGRIYVNSVQLDVPMEYLSDAHLGDKVVLEAMIVVKRVLPNNELHEEDLPD